MKNKSNKKSIKYQLNPNSLNRINSSNNLPSIPTTMSSRTINPHNGSIKISKKNDVNNSITKALYISNPIKKVRATSNKRRINRDFILLIVGLLTIIDKAELPNFISLLFSQIFD